MFCDDERVLFEKMPFENLDFADNYFELVTMSNVLDHMPDPKLVLEKVRRALNKRSEVLNY